jgi:hypothetical protein
VWNYSTSKLRSIRWCGGLCARANKLLEPDCTLANTTCEASLLHSQTPFSRMRKTKDKTSALSLRSSGGGPGNTSLDKWLGRWPALVNSAKRYTIENLSEPQICEAFVEACPDINPPFYNYMKSKDAQTESQASVINQTETALRKIGCTHCSAEYDQSRTCELRPHYGKRFE